MGIKKDDTKFSIEFSWVGEGKAGKASSTVYSVKFHNTRELGDTISVSQGGEGLNLPAKLFVEVVDFLRTEGIIPPPEGELALENKELDDDFELDESPVKNEKPVQSFLSANTASTAVPSDNQPDDDIELPIIDGETDESPSVAKMVTAESNNAESAIIDDGSKKSLADRAKERKGFTQIGGRKSPPDTKKIKPKG